MLLSTKVVFIPHKYLPFVLLVYEENISQVIIFIRNSKVFRVYIRVLLGRV